MRVGVVRKSSTQLQLFGGSATSGSAVVVEHTYAHVEGSEPAH